MTLYLYGVVGGNEAIDFGTIGFDKGNVRNLPVGQMGGIVGPAPDVSFQNLPKERLITLLLSHQQTLEAITKKMFVLPFKFGTVVKDEAEVKRVLGGGRTFLGELMRQMQGCSEIDVVATWEVPKILQEISDEDPEIAACKREGQEGTADRAFVGMLLAQGLERRAQEWRERIALALESHAQARSDHDLLNDQMVLNSSFLISRDQDDDFSRSVEEVDKIFEGKLNFKCVGPLPPYSFATLQLRRFDPQEVREAAAILGLNGSADLEKVKKIYRELSRGCHPDTHPDLSKERFERLNKAYELLADYCKEGARSLEKEAIERCVQLSVGGK